MWLTYQLWLGPLWTITASLAKSWTASIEVCRAGDCINQINKYTSRQGLNHELHVLSTQGTCHTAWVWFIVDGCELVTFSPVLSRLAIASNRPKREPRPKSIKVNTINTQQNGSSHRSSVKSVISSGNWLNCWANLICSIHFHNVISVFFISVNHVLLS